MPHPEIFQALSPGVQLLLDDGKVRLEVVSCQCREARTRVVVGGPLSDRKGVSVVGAVLPLSALTPKDRIDLAYALELGVDWIALSFVQRPEDVEEIRGIVGGRAGVISKLEKPSAIEQPGRHRRPLGRRHGGPRRPRRGDAARTGAADPAADRPEPAGRRANPASSRRRCWSR